MLILASPLRFLSGLDNMVTPNRTSTKTYGKAFSV